MNSFVSRLEVDFERIKYDRKSERYRKIIEICRIILFNYHPSLTAGRNNVLAIMFDMNVLWEKFVFKSIKQGLKKIDNSFSVREQNSAPFWKMKNNLGYLRILG